MNETRYRRLFYFENVLRNSQTVSLQLLTGSFFFFLSGCWLRENHQGYVVGFFFLDLSLSLSLAVFSFLINCVGFFQL